ncbi:hypothetical protein HYU14_04820 [Candidatus Woesearchaeota archaeon]|nr:hypothetical protein [Candidatus Woesearchaeota archaeon]
MASRLDNLLSGANLTTLPQGIVARYIQDSWVTDAHSPPPHRSLISLSELDNLASEAFNQFGGEGVTLPKSESLPPEGYAHVAYEQRRGGHPIYFFIEQGKEPIPAGVNFGMDGPVSWEGTRYWPLTGFSALVLPEQTEIWGGNWDLTGIPKTFDLRVFIPRRGVAEDYSIVGQEAIIVENGSPQKGWRASLVPDKKYARSSPGEAFGIGSKVLYVSPPIDIIADELETSKANVGMALDFGNMIDVGYALLTLERLGFIKLKAA